MLTIQSRNEKWRNLTYYSIFKEKQTVWFDSQPKQIIFTTMTKKKLAWYGIDRYRNYIQYI